MRMAFLRTLMYDSSLSGGVVRRTQDHGIGLQDVIIDPLAVSVGVMDGAGASLFAIVRRCVEEMGVDTICGASNFSFGLRNRPALKGAFIAMVISAGMPCAISNPLEREVRQAVLAADVLIGHDPHCHHRLGAQLYAKALTADPTHFD